MGRSGVWRGLPPVCNGQFFLVSACRGQQRRGQPLHHCLCVHGTIGILSTRNYLPGTFSAMPPKARVSVCGSMGIQMHSPLEQYFLVKCNINNRLIALFT